MSTLKFAPSLFVIVLDVILKGDRPLAAKLVLDTGASKIVLSWKLAVAIGLKIDPNITMKTTTATTVETVPAITIPEVSVLDKKVKNVGAIIKDLPAESHVDGLLGLSFLKHFKLTIDFKKGLLSLD